MTESFYPPTLFYKEPKKGVQFGYLHS